MSRVGEELDRRLNENKYELYDACKYFTELRGYFNSMLYLEATDKEIIEMLNSDMDKLGDIIDAVLAKVENKENES